MTIYEADWVCPGSSPPIRNGRLAVDNGIIAAVYDRLDEDRDNIAAVRFPGCAIIPGFVNAHCHLELTVLRGFLDDLPFTDWIPRLTHAKYQVLTRADMLLSSRLGAIEMLRAGVTCVGEVMDLGTAWHAMREFGLQGVAYQEVFGPAPNQMAEALTDLKSKIDEYRRCETETLRIGASPHAPYTVSATLYKAVNEYAQHENLRIATHIAESADEGLFVRSGTGVFAERWRERGIAFQPPACSPLAYLDTLGLLRPETLLIHGIDLDDSDFQRLAEKRPTLVHCPKSNAKLAHGVARIPDIRNTGIAVGLGTDSVASNNVVDMFEEMRAAIFQQRGRTHKINALDAQTVFRMATLGGAECLGLDARLGSLDPGKRADFAVVDLNDPAVQPVYDPIDAMVYSAARHNIRATYVGGHEVTPDPADLLRELRDVVVRL
jgi:cytosine/adenosine deaminase-related metal-dependent hydrolase